jgi:hypothetical protein
MSIIILVVKCYMFAIVGSKRSFAKWVGDNARYRDDGCG